MTMMMMMMMMMKVMSMILVVDEDVVSSGVGDEGDDEDHDVYGVIFCQCFNDDAQIDGIHSDDVDCTKRRCNYTEHVQEAMLSIMMLSMIHNVVK